MPLLPSFLRHRPIPSILGFASWIPLYIIFNDHVGQVMWVNGPSMYPYLNTDYDRSTAKDAVWVDKTGPTAELRRGMCVAFWSPNDPTRLAVKRILALQGDTVRPLAPSGSNGVNAASSLTPTKVTVPFGHMWVEGEDRHRTLDSNTYGAVSTNLIVGKVRGVVWPWHRRGALLWEDWKDKEGRVEVAPEGSVKRPSVITDTQ